MFKVEMNSTRMKRLLNELKVFLNSAKGKSDAVIIKRSVQQKGGSGFAITTEKLVRKFSEGLRDKRLKRIALSIFGGIEDSLLLSVDQVTDEILQELKIPGSPIKYPVEWDSEKQRRYVMAKLSKDNNLPYKRTGEFSRNWQKTALPGGFEVSNQTPYAFAVSGAMSRDDGDLKVWQSNIHKDRWKNIGQVIRDKISSIPEKVKNNIRMKK